MSYERESYELLQQILTEVQVLTDPLRKKARRKAKRRFEERLTRQREVEALWTPYFPTLSMRAYNILCRNELTPEFVRSQSDEAMLDRRMRMFGPVTLANVREALASDVAA